jgi:hypothetical protein
MAVTHGWKSWLEVMAGSHGWKSWLEVMAGSHGWKSWLEVMDWICRPCLATPATSAVHVLSIDRTDNGIMRFLWNMPTGILFLTTRSPRFAAF